MALEDDIEFIGQLLDRYVQTAWRKGVADDLSDETCVPLEMHAGEVAADGWVEWKVLPSTLEESDVAELEQEFHVQFPPLFRAYLLARFHLFDQVRSRKYDQQIFMTDVPSNRRLKPLRTVLSNWSPLIDAGFIPFAEWGDGWGPMCFDAEERQSDGECPIIWMDHEQIVPLGEEECRKRGTIQPLAQPLYASCREFLLDVFGTE